MALIREGDRVDRASSQLRLPLLGVALLLYGLALAGYYVARYRGMWMEGDTSHITRTIEVMQKEGTLSPPGGAYVHGFGYQATAVMLLSATGLAPQALQTLIYPFVALLALGLASQAFYARMARDRNVAILASLLLLLQPDVLFVTLRGSHEKLGWPLMMIALILLYRSIGQPVRKIAVYVSLFYAAVFAMIAVNVFFASTFLTAVVLGLILGLIILAFLRRRERLLPTDLSRLVYVTASGGILVFVFLTNIYPVALSNLRLLRTIAEQVSALLLSFEIRAQPYEYISFGWTSPRVYLGLTIFTWLLIVGSFAEWLRRGRRILDGRDALSLRESLDWLLYAGFALQVAVSIVVDFAGVLSSNLQLRVFPGFTVLAAGPFARGIWRVTSRRWFQGRIRRVGLVLALLAVVWFALASVFKASNEPSFSNKWGFYSWPEDASLRWTDEYLRFATVWTAFDGRLSAAFASNYGYRSTGGNTYAAITFKPEDRYVLFSESERWRGLRLGLAMPAVASWNRVYDNGDVYLYHRRPLTPYQR